MRLGATAVYWEERLVASTTSPDGALRLEDYCREGERSPAHYHLKLVQAAGGAHVLVPLGEAFRVGEVEFGAGDSLRVTLRFDGSDIPARIDTVAKTFYFHPHDPPEPLDFLPKRLRERFIKPIPPERPTLRRMLVILLELAGALLLFAASLWATLLGGPDNRPWVGWLGLALFGAATLFSLLELI